MHQNGHIATSGFGEKADSVIAVKRNAEFNATIRYDEEYNMDSKAEYTA